MIYEDMLDASPASGVLLSTAHISKALRGPEAPSSLDLSHLNLSEIPDEAVHQLAQLPSDENDGTIHRIALSNNHLRTLPLSFNLLSRLRYLNLRSNALYQFPEVLSDMESLEILDLSRNKIKAFPAVPGSLIHIRVLHLGRNRITALPSYFPSFRELNLLKIEHNPIEWPPPHVLNATANNSDPLVAARWVNSIQGWIKDHLTRYGGPTMTPGRNSAEDLRDEDERRADAENGRYSAHDRTPSNDSQYSNFSHSEHPSSPQGERIINQIVNKLLPPENFDGYSSSDFSASLDGHGFLQPQHGRNASLTYAKKQNGTSMGLQGKKSLPELRNMQLRPNERSKLRGRPPLPPSNASVENLSSSQLSVQHHAKGSSSDTGHTIRPSRSALRDEDMAAVAENAMGQGQPPSMDGPRNLYFKRMSTLPASTISKAVPKELLVTIDAARGILFALSQIYSALRHYIVFAINDRLAGVLNKVLDPASQYLARLITALDRFDALCRSGTPPPAACRGVLEGCRDNITVFSKVIGVLQIQLKVLAGSDDVRYTRTLLLMLYGSMAELSNSWMAIAPHVEEVKNLVRDARATQAASTNGSGSVTPSGVSSRTPQTIPENEEATTMTPRSAQPPGRPRILPPSGRRQGGSFSATDVRKGRDMPIVGRERDNSIGGSAVGIVQPLQIKAPSAASKALRSHLRQAPGNGSPRSGHGHHSPSLSSSSHGHDGYNNASLSSDKDKFVDASTLSAMEQSTDLALSVWKQVEDLFEVHMNGEGGVIGRDYLMRAKELTMALRSNIQAVLDGADGEAYGAALWEGANTFSKDVTNVLMFVRKTCTERRIPLDPSIRADIQKLANSTQEFVTFLAFSSFAAGKPPPSPAPSSYASPSISTPGFASPALPSNYSSGGNPGFASPSLYDERAPTPSSANPSTTGFGSSDLMPPSAPLWRSRSANVVVGVGSPPPPAPPGQGQQHHQQGSIIGRGGGIGGGMAGGGPAPAMQRSGPAHPSLRDFKMPTTGNRIRPGGGIVGYKDSD